MARRRKAPPFAERFRERVLPYIGPSLAVISSVGLLYVRFGELSASDHSHDDQVKSLQQDVRELRNQVSIRCKD